MEDKVLSNLEKQLAEKEKELEALADGIEDIQQAIKTFANSTDDYTTYRVTAVLKALNLVASIANDAYAWCKQEIRHIKSEIEYTQKRSVENENG